MSRETINLCDIWRFQPDPAGEGEKLSYMTTNYDDMHWRQVRVPADFSLCHPALQMYEGVGWFRRKIHIPARWRDQRIWLHFEGVNDHAKVWLNGQVVGSHEHGFLPFDIDIQEGARFGEQNVIVVRADNIHRPGELPGMQRGWRAFGGILREVALWAADPLHIAQVQVVGQGQSLGVAAQPVGHIMLQATVTNDRSVAVTSKVRAQVLDGDAVLADFVTSTLPLAPSATTEVTLQGPVPDAQLWSPDVPNLYTVQVSLHELTTDDALETAPVDLQSIRTGFRTLEVRDGELLLNGNPLFLTGFNRHEDSPRTNMCPDLDRVRQDLAAMKKAGSNFVRLCHYPHHPAELDLCDELGLLAMGEIPLYWWNGEEAGEENFISKIEAAKYQLGAMIVRDIHHPSLIFWSVSNENQEQRPEVAAGNRELVRLAKQLDPSRLAVHVSDHWQQHPNFEADDVLCVNAYPSVWALQQDPTYDLAQSTVFWRDQLAALHAQYPDKPILVTEFGAMSFHGVRGGTYGEDTHAAVLDHEFQGMDAPYICGTTVWCWADHPWPGPGTFGNTVAQSPYGVLNRERQPRAPFRTIRRLFREKQGLHKALISSKPHRGSAGYEVHMIRPHMRDIPQFPLPPGYRIRPMRADYAMALDEAGLWADIERDAEQYFPIGDDLFRDQFGYHPQATQWRCYFLINAQGVAVGTISAWYNQNFKGGVWGQIHWLALRPAYWGKGLAKPMLSYTLTQMAQWHDRAFLGTQTQRFAAIKIYLDFGFVPDMEQAGASEMWREVKAVLKHPALEALSI